MLVLLGPGRAEAISLIHRDSLSLDLKGSYKNLFFTSNEMATGDRTIADLNRLRTEWDLAAGRHFSAKLIWDNELIGGDYVSTAEFGRRQTNRNEPFGDLEYELVREPNFFYGQDFYRAYGRFESERLTATVGRQKIDWGVMRLIAPGDLFTRLPLFDVEKEERVGSTAVNVVVPVSPSFRLNPVYTIEDDFDRSRTGLRATKTVGRFDLSLLGGRFLRDAIAGFDWTGDVKEIGIRGEFLYDWAAEGENFIQAAAGVDYGFTNSLTVALEYFFNGQGTNNLLTAQPFPATGPFVQTVHQNFISGNAKFDLTPLWTVRGDLVADLNCGSFFVNPETRYSLFEWLELSGGAQFNTGRGNGEFTALPHLYYLQGQLFF